MNIQFVFDWKFVVALSAGATVVILASKVDPKDAKDALVASANAVAEGFKRLR